jgi:hypothetical protein
MKLRLICLLLAGVVFSLAAQTNQTISVFMQPFTGTGIDQYDSSFYYMLIYRELEAHDQITMGRGRSSTDFSLIGAISPTGTGGASSPEYRFELRLQNNRTNEIMLEQGYRYSRLDNAEIAINTILDNIYKQILPVQPVQQPVEPVRTPVEPVQSTVEPVQQPVQPIQQPIQPAPQPVQPIQQPVQPVRQPVQPIQQPVQQPVEPVQSAEPVEPVQPVTPGSEGDWRDRWVFLGLSVFWNPRIYADEDWQTPYLGNFVMGFYPELRFLDSVSLETGLGLSSDRLKNGKEEYRDLMLEVPVLVKIVLKPGDIFLLQPYSGVCLNFSLFGATNPPLLSWGAGYQHGVKAGPGDFLFDFRFSMDLGKSKLEEREGIHPTLEYQRFSLSLGVGYKYGIIPKR